MRFLVAPRILYDRAMVQNAGSTGLNYADLDTIDFMRANFGDTMGAVSIVLASAINNKDVNVAALTMPVSNNTLEKIIMIRALVCSNQPINDPSPGAHLSNFPASTLTHK